MYSRALGIFCVSVFLASWPARSQDVEIFAPEVVAPVEALPEVDYPDPLPGESMAEEMPEPFALTPEELTKAQEAALADPNAEPPDEVLVLAPRSGSATPAVSFPGLDYVAGGQKTPPDVGVARSTDRVLEAVNAALRLFDTNGTIRVTKTTASFFGLPESPGVFDPKAFYDRNSQRFFLVVLESITNGDPQRLFLAVSRNPNPTGLDAAQWCRYSMEARTDITTANKTFADYPSVGVGRDVVMVTTNQFVVAPPNQSLGYPILRLFAKASLTNNATGSCPSLPASSIFRPLALASFSTANAQTLQPVQHYTLPSATGGTSGYLISGKASPSKGYRVWRVRDGATAAPRLEFTEVLGLRMYTKAPNATQPAGIALDTGDTRILQAAGVGDSIWAVQTTGCQISTGNNEACFRVLRFNASPTTSGFLAPIAEQATAGLSADNFLWMPSIAATNSGRIGLALHMASAALPHGAGWLTKISGTSAFSSLNVLRAGTCSRGGSGFRSGDFSGAQADPDGTSLWLAGENFGTVGTSCNWQTGIIKVVP
ncbi:MAG TPA: hypothetical protein VN851_07900 [Thermoanaerobaculia bacterium]|nr:hypothetical protein [Thermoanaerobaculia bacterium]